MFDYKLSSDKKHKNMLVFIYTLKLFHLEKVLWRSIKLFIWRGRSPLDKIFLDHLSNGRTYFALWKEFACLSGEIVRLWIKISSTI